MKKLLGYTKVGLAVVGWQAARLGCSLLDTLNTANPLRERGVSVWFISYVIDAAISIGRKMRHACIGWCWAIYYRFDTERVAKPTN